MVQGVLFQSPLSVGCFQDHPFETYLTQYSFAASSVRGVGQVKLLCLSFEVVHVVGNNGRQDVYICSHFSESCSVTGVVWFLRDVRPFSDWATRLQCKKLQGRMTNTTVRPCDLRTQACDLRDDLQSVEASEAAADLRAV